MKKVMKLQVPQKMENFLTTEELLESHAGSLFHGVTYKYNFLCSIQYT